MSDGVLASIISGAISLIGIIVTVVVSNRKMMDDLAVVIIFKTCQNL